MSYEEIRDLVKVECEYDYNIVAKKYSKKDLLQMFRDLYGIEARTSATKKDLAIKIWDFIVNTERTLDLAKNLRM